MAFIIFSASLLVRLVGYLRKSTAKIAIFIFSPMIYFHIYSTGWRGRYKLRKDTTHTRTTRTTRTHLLDFFRELEPFDVLLGLQDSLHVAVALQQALAIQVPLLDVLLPPGVNALE